jgi:ferritin-like protein
MTVRSSSEGILADDRADAREELIEMLKKAYFMEIETVMSYITNSINPDGVRAQEIIESLKTDVQEEHGHAQEFANRIKQLYGTVPGSMEFTPEQWQDLYIQFILDCKVPKFASNTHGELYETNKKKELGTKALASLSRIGDASQADLFKELLLDPDPERRRLAIEGLGRVSDGSMTTGFKKDYQRERSEDLRLAYSFALTKLGDRAFVDSLVLALPSRSLGPRSRSYLLELGPSVLPELYPYLTDPDAEIRAGLCDIIAQMGDADSIARLNPLLNDPSTKVADRANRAAEMLRRAPGAKPAR